MTTLSSPAQNDKSVRIYALVDPRSYEIRYVGRTTGTLERRLKEHLRDAKYHRDSAPRFPWIRQLLQLGLRPHILPIAEYPITCMQEAEGYWIAYFRSIGADLLNVPYRNGHEGPRFQDFVWTDAILARLGTLPDAVLAQELGLTRRAIEGKRHKLGIPKCGNLFYVIPPMGGWNRIELPDAIITQLGTMPDTQLGRLYGVSKKRILKERKKHNILSFADVAGHPTRYHSGQSFENRQSVQRKPVQHYQNPPHRFASGEPHPRWDIADKRLQLTPELIARLGTVSDLQLAKELGYKSKTPITNARYALGIPSHMARTKRERG